jgi:hypothetical protein
MRRGLVEAACGFFLRRTPGNNRQRAPKRIRCGIGCFFAAPGTGFAVCRRNHHEPQLLSRAVASALDRRYSRDRDDFITRAILALAPIDKRRFDFNSRSLW